MEAPTQYKINRFKLYQAPWLTDEKKFIKLTLKPRQTGRVATGPLNVKIAPDDSSSSLRTLSKGELVDIIDKRGEWLKISDTEWVHSKFIEVSFAAKVQKIYNEKKVIHPDDIQKDRWGGESKSNEWELKAGVTKNKMPKSYNVILTVTAAKSNTTGEVAFFLHDSFGEQIRYEQIVKGKAQLEVTAYEAFTAGAYTQDNTMLELDLNEQEDYPKGFYYDEVADNFKSKAEALYHSIDVIVKNDLQKQRWGGKSIDKGKMLSASVINQTLSPNYKIEIVLSSENSNIPFNGDVAFFLHDSFSDEIRYKKARNGIAKITVTAYEDFTVGAYTDDGAILELDLHEVKGFPQGFYSKK